MRWTQPSGGDKILYLTCIIITFQHRQHANIVLVVAERRPGGGAEQGGAGRGQQEAVELGGRGLQAARRQGQVQKALLQVDPARKGHTPRQRLRRLPLDGAQRPALRSKSKDKDYYETILLITTLVSPVIVRAGVPG